MKHLTPFPPNNKALFPQSDQPGNDTNHINTALIQQLSKNETPLNSVQLQKLVKAHLVFLMSGGAGGFWKTILIKGLVLGIYEGPESKEGQQASFEKKHLGVDLEMSSLELPFANFCGVYAEGVNFSGTDLSHCLFTDSMLKDVVFQNAKMNNSDFSRANLAGVSFVGADCSGVDFENTNLEGADFTNARLNGARFPGANLEGVIY